MSAAENTSAPSGRGGSVKSLEAPPTAKSKIAGRGHITSRIAALREMGPQNDNTTAQLRKQAFSLSQYVALVEAEAADRSKRSIKVHKQHKPDRASVLREYIYGTAQRDGRLPPRALTMQQRARESVTRYYDRRCLGAIRSSGIFIHGHRPLQREPNVTKKHRKVRKQSHRTNCGLPRKFVARFKDDKKGLNEMQHYYEIAWLSHQPLVQLYAGNVPKHASTSTAQERPRSAAATALSQKLNHRLNNKKNNSAAGHANVDPTKWVPSTSKSPLQQLRLGETAIDLTSVRHSAQRPSSAVPPSRRSRSISRSGARSFCSLPRQNSAPSTTSNGRFSMVKAGASGKGNLEKVVAPIAPSSASSREPKPAGAQKHLMELMKFLHGRSRAWPSAFMGYECEADPLDSLDAAADEGEELQPIDANADEESSPNSRASFSSTVSVASKVMSFGAKLRSKARRSRLIRSYKTRRMISKREYEILAEEAKEFFGTSDGIIRVDQELVESLSEHLQQMQPQGEEHRHCALSAVLRRKATELLLLNDCTATFAIYKYTDDPAMLELFLRYCMHVEEERKRIRRRRESMKMLSQSAVQGSVPQDSQLQLQPQPPPQYDKATYSAIDRLLGRGNAASRRWRFVVKERLKEVVASKNKVHA